MATQYRDGSFGEIKGLPEAMEEFNQALQADQAKAFYVGSQIEVEKQIEQAKETMKLEDFNQRLKSLEMKQREEEFLEKPSREELAKILASKIDGD